MANSTLDALRPKTDSTGQLDVGKSLAGKFMTFKLSREEYALEILKVREIIGLMDITRTPKTHSSIRGVINLRGKVIPVLDLRIKFGMPHVDAADQNVIIVVHCVVAGQELTMGILVDEVVEVLDIQASQIEPTPSFGAQSLDSDFILGIGKADKRVIFLLDIGKVLTAGELEQMRTPVD